MSKLVKVEIQVKRLLEIDEFVDQPTPFVKITCQSNGELLSSGNGRKIKGTENNYLFNGDDESNKLTFQLASKSEFEFSLSVFSKDKSSSQIVCYQGVGKFKIPNSGEDVEQNGDCPLLEDGNAELECGQFLYSYTITQPPSAPSNQSSPIKQIPSLTSSDNTSALSSPFKQKFSPNKVIQLILFLSNKLIQLTSFLTFHFTGRHLLPAAVSRGRGGGARAGRDGALHVSEQSQGQLRREGGALSVVRGF